MHQLSSEILARLRASSPDELQALGRPPPKTGSAAVSLQEFLALRELRLTAAGANGG